MHAPLDITLVIIAKECIPGKVKTRLHPPLSYEQAAQVAEASLNRTLRIGKTLPVKKRILYFDGTLLPLEADGYEILPQVDGDLDERLAFAFDHIQGPILLLGMDTPQVSYNDLTPVFKNWDDNVDAWFGPANDGGFWGLALRESDGNLLRGVPMSETNTGEEQIKRLEAASLKVGYLTELIDVDTIEDAHAVASLIPGSLFASLVNRT